MTSSSARYQAAGGRSAPVDAWLRWARRYHGYRFLFGGEEHWGRPAWGSFPGGDRLPLERNSATFHWSYVKRGNRHDHANGITHESLHEAKVKALTHLFSRPAFSDKVPILRLSYCRYFMFLREDNTFLEWFEAYLLDDARLREVFKRTRMGIGRRIRTWSYAPDGSRLAPVDQFIFSR